MVLMTSRVTYTENREHIVLTCRRHRDARYITKGANANIFMIVSDPALVRELHPDWSDDMVATASESGDYDCDCSSLALCGLPWDIVMTDSPIITAFPLSRFLDDPATRWGVVGYQIDVRLPKKVYFEPITECLYSMMEENPAHYAV